MVGSKQLSNKLKITPKVLLRTQQAAAATPHQQPLQPKKIMKA